MTQEEIVKKVKEFRKRQDELLQEMGDLIPDCRAKKQAEIHAVNTGMWLGQVLKFLNEKNPYPESRNPENAIIEPTADGLKYLDE